MCLSIQGLRLSLRSSEAAGQRELGSWLSRHSWLNPAPFHFLLVARFQRQGSPGVPASEPALSPLPASPFLILLLRDPEFYISLSSSATSSQKPLMRPGLQVFPSPC